VRTQLRAAYNNKINASRNDIKVMEKNREAKRDPTAGRKDLNTAHPSENTDRQRRNKGREVRDVHP